MIRDKKYPLLSRPLATTGVYQSINPSEAGWQFLHFAARKMHQGDKWHHYTGQNEFAFVILGGMCSVQSSGKTWTKVGRRSNVFSGMPYAFYLPKETDFTIIAESHYLDIAFGWCPADEHHPARLISPRDVTVEIRGGGNATRQINNIIPPGFDCQHLVVVEVYTPSGNWSSYPPHKHDRHRKNSTGEVVEACLEEIYFYKIDQADGYAIQHIYTDDRRIDELTIAHNDDVILVPAGYHPVAAAHGYNVYYLNFLAGSAQSLAHIDDPAHSWIKNTWKEKDPRLPMVTLDMET